MHDPHGVRPPAAGFSRRRLFPGAASRFGFASPRTFSGRRRVLFWACVGAVLGKRFPEYCRVRQGTISEVNVGARVIPPGISTTKPPAAWPARRHPIFSASNVALPIPVFACTSTFLAAAFRGADDDISAMRAVIFRRRLCRPPSFWFFFLSANRSLERPPRRAFTRTIQQLAARKFQFADFEIGRYPRRTRIVLLLHSRSSPSFA